MEYPLIVITGPTAVGKTKLAVSVADTIKAEIINADSRQVYRQMDIGTGKDLQEYNINGRSVPYHLIGICEPGYQYNIKEYQEDFSAIYNELQTQHILPILCGGSGLYIESALEGNPFAFVPMNLKLRKKLANESISKLISQISEHIIKELNITKLTTTKRLIRAIEISMYTANRSQLKRKEPIDAIIFAIDLKRSLVMERIKSRLKYRLEHGLIEEVEYLLSGGLTPEQLIYYGLEYRWVTRYLLKEITYSEMFERLNIAIRQFAKRQMTWFRRMEKKGYTLNWLDGSKTTEEQKAEVLALLDHKAS